jgi:DNA-binding GntR family transcriptional regulator
MFQNRKSLGQEVVSFIKNGIRNGDYVQGERIVESKLARDLGLSLTPIREAVRELVGEGILTVSPNRGPSVRILSLDDAFELYTLRAQLECLAIRLAIRRSSESERESIAGILQGMEASVDDPAIETLQESSRQIHEGIVTLSRHDWLISFYSSLSLQIALLNRLVARTSNKEHEVLWHRPVVQALLDGDPDDAELVMRQHIRESYETYVGAFSEDSTPGALKPVELEWL